MMAKRPDYLLWGLYLLFFSILGLIALECLAGPLPDPVMTPGIVNPNVSQKNIRHTICKSGWTKLVRPSVNYTNKIKAQQMKAYGYPVNSILADFEEDHLISIELGGHPRDSRNLWPQPYAAKCGARVKDRIENKLRRLVCAKKLSLVDAQKAIVTDWTEAYRQYIGPLNCNL